MATIDDTFPIIGSCGTVDFATRKNGTQPAKKELERLKKRAPRKYGRIIAVFRHFSKVGDEIPPNYMDRYSGTDIWKFKTHAAYPWRFPYFRLDGVCYLTHVFEKMGTKQVQDQIKKAETIKKEHLERANGK